MIKLITDDEYGMGNWFNVLVVAYVYVVMHNVGKSLPLGSVCDVAGCDSYELGRMVSRVVQHLEINLLEFDIVRLFRRVVTEMFNKFCIGKEKLARVMQQGVFLLQCMIKWYKELLETLVEVARVCLPWGNDVSVKNIMKNAPFVIQYMEVKSTCERGNEVMSLEEVSPECLSNIYLKFVEEYSNIKTLTKRLKNNNMERSGKSKLFVDTTDLWKGNSKLSKKLFLDKILETDVGFKAMPPSFVSGCLKTDRIKEKIQL
ncbi:plant-specific TFIIB-related protein PTF2, partial [Tanacetum coccineum]